MVEDDDVETEYDLAQSHWLKPLAETCLQFLTHQKRDTVLGMMTRTQAAELVAHLKRALRKGPYEEPFAAPRLQPGQLLQSLFPGRRLGAFQRMLQDTA